MLPYAPLQLTVLLLSTVILSTQTDMTIKGAYFEQVFRGQLPGICCRPPPPDIINPGTRARFEHLLAGDIAVVWSGRAIPGVPIYITGCSGLPVETHVGPARF